MLLPKPLPFACYKRAVGRTVGVHGDVEGGGDSDGSDLLARAVDADVGVRDDLAGSGT